MTCMDLSTVVYTTGVSRSAFNSSHTWRTVLGPSFQSARMIINSASVGNGTGFESEGGIRLRNTIYEELRRLSIEMTIACGWRPYGGELARCSCSYAQRFDAEAADLAEEFTRCGFAGDKVIEL